MKKLIILIICLGMIIVGCSRQDDLTKVTKNYSEVLASGEYRFVQDAKLSTVRNLHKERARSKTDIAAINRGLMEISKLHFPSEQYLLNELDILSYDRLTSNGLYDFDDVALLNYVSESNPYGLNPEKSKAYTFGNTTVTGPELITDLFELDFVRENDKSTKVSGVSVALILAKKPFNQENKDVSIDESELIRYGQEASNKLQNYLVGLPQLTGVPIVVSLFVADSQDSNVPGHYVGYTIYDQGASRYVDLKEEYNYLGNVQDKNVDGDLNNLFTIYVSEINSILYENVGVVGLLRRVNNQNTDLNIEINAQFKSFVEEELMIRKINELFAQFSDTSYNILVTLKDVNEVKAVFERKVNQTSVNYIRRS